MLVVVLVLVVVVGTVDDVDKEANGSIGLSGRTEVAVVVGGMVVSAISIGVFCGGRESECRQGDASRTRRGAVW